MKKKKAIIVLAGIALVGLALFEIRQNKKALKKLETIKDSIVNGWPEKEEETDN